VDAGNDQGRIRVLLAEDQVMIREALATLLGLEPDIAVVGQVGRGDEVVRAVAEAEAAAAAAAQAGATNPTATEAAKPHIQRAFGSADGTRENRSSHGVDVVLLDIEMPGLDGLSAAAELRKTYPHVKVVILTTFGRPGFLRRAMEAGAAAFMVKDAPAARLAEAVRRVLAGERVIDPDLAAAALADGVNPLTGRERDVLAASADGSVNSEIAAKLSLSEGTVRNYLSACIQKTGARNRAEAVRIAQEKGWL
jgi:two-component system response regulator DesR